MFRSRPTSSRSAPVPQAIALVAVATVIAACSDPVASPVAPAGAPPPLAARGAPAPSHPSGKGIGVIGSKVNRTTQQIEYHGGPVMLGTPQVYFVWYGNWAGMTARQQILTDLVSNLGGSSYFQINTLYTDALGQSPVNGIQYAGAATDAYSQGTNLEDYQVLFVALDAISGGFLPPDPNGIYVVVPSADVNVTSGFGTAYCGFHNQATYNGGMIQIVLLGNADRAPTTCQPQAVGPNGDAGADAMASVLANEISNTITDPGFTAWYDKTLLEQADKCAWSYGTTYAATNGARANVRLGARDYLLQQLWVPGKRGACALGA
jgi:hypothetical protein